MWCVCQATCFVSNRNQTIYARTQTSFGFASWKCTYVLLRIYVCVSLCLCLCVCVYVRTSTWDEKAPSKNPSQQQFSHHRSYRQQVVLFTVRQRTVKYTTVHARVCMNRNWDGETESERRETHIHMHTQRENMNILTEERWQINERQSIMTDFRWSNVKEKRRRSTSRHSKCVPVSGCWCFILHKRQL